MVLAKASGYTDAEFGLASLSLRRGNLTEAEKDFSYLVAAQASDFGSQLGLANTLLAENRNPEAREHFAAAAAIHSHSLEAVQGIAQAALQSGDTVGAEQALNKAAAIRDDGENHRLRAMTYAAEICPDAALEELRAWAKLEPSQPGPHRALAQLLAILADFKSALEEQHRVLAVAPDSASDRNDLGVLEARSGQKLEARRNLEHALKLDLRTRKPGTISASSRAAQLLSAQVTPMGYSVAPSALRKLQPMVETCDIAVPTTVPTSSVESSYGVVARIFSFPVVLVMSLTLALTLFVSTAGPGRDVTDPDIWWHLANAHQLYATGHFIHYDVFSFSVSGQPWINFEWLGELPFYAAFTAFGFRGIFLASLFLMEAIVLGVFGLCLMRSRDLKASFLASGIALLFTSVSMGPRTLLCGWLCLVVELAVLWAFQEERDYLWILPALFVFWINAHGTWLIGFGIFVMFAACTFVKGTWGAVEAQTYSASARKKLHLVIAVTAAALFLNPYGWKLVFYPFNFALNQQFNLNFVDEWATLNLHETLGKAALAIVMLLGIASLTRKRTWKLFDLCLLLLVIYSGFTYSRFIFMTGIVLAPFAAIELRGLLGPYERELERSWINALALTILVSLIAWRIPSERTLQQHRDETFPNGALARLQQLPQGHVFNTYEWGGYMMRYAPNIPTFVDSRTDIFIQHGVLPEYLDAIKGWRSYETLDKYDIRYVLLPSNTAMGYLLAHDKNWHREYSDTHSLLFGRVETRQ